MTDSNESTTIDWCLVNNIDVLNGAIAGGISGLLRSNEEKNCTITNCKSQNANFEYTSNYDFYSTFVAGIAGHILQGKIVNISNCESENIKINSYGMCKSGGIVGESLNSRFIMSKNHVKTLEINESDMAGGLCGYNVGNSAEFSECEASDININGEIIGGVIGESRSDLQIINNCNTNKLKLTATYFAGGIDGISYFSAEIGNCNVQEAESSGRIVGGIIGVSNSGTHTIDNCNVNKTKITTTYFAGGIVGNSDDDSSSSTKMTNCKIEDSEINGSSAGAIGGICSINGTIYNCQVNNLNITGDCNIGGITAIDGSIEECNVDNLKIYATVKETSNYNYGSKVAGISAINNKNVIKKCGVTNSEMINNSENGPNTITEFSGGILGIGLGCEDCSVESTKIQSVGKQPTYSEEGYRPTGFTGGIAGIATTIKSCNVNNINIISNMNATGGIMGHGNNQKSYDGRDIKGGQTLIWNCNVADSNIEGLNEVGGICGASSQTVTDCIVSGTNIKGNGKYIGGIVGFGGLLKIVDGKYITINNPLTLTNCHANDCKMYGNEYCNNIVGRNSYGNDPSADVITNCDAPGTTVSALQ